MIFIAKAKANPSLNSLLKFYALAVWGLAATHVLFRGRWRPRSLSRLDHFVAFESLFGGECTFARVYPHYPSPLPLF